MDEDIAIINKSTREEKIKDFYFRYKGIIFTIVIVIITFLFSIFFYNDYKDKQNKKLANKYLSIQINYSEDKKEYYSNELINIVNENNKTYSILALSFLIDNNILQSNKVINNLFDQLINEANSDKDTKNLLIYKKAIFNSNYVNENELITILNPIINSESVWRSPSLLLIGDFFLAKNEKEKAKDFFKKILIDQESNKDIIYQAQQRLRSLLSE